MWIKEFTSIILTTHCFQGYASSCGLFMTLGNCSIYQIPFQKHIVWNKIGDKNRWDDQNSATYAAGGVSQD
jgi:hypothetical protein